MQQTYMYKIKKNSADNYSKKIIALLFEITLFILITFEVNLKK